MKMMADFMPLNFGHIVDKMPLPKRARSQLFDEWREEDSMKKDKKLTLSKETLRTLDDQELSLVVGGAQSGSNTPPNGGPNSCPNTKRPGCS